MALTAKKLEAVRPGIPVEEVNRENRARINFDVTKETRMRWKMAALRQGVTLAALIETAVNESLSLSGND
jgi:hypothetical protein